MPFEVQNAIKQGTPGGQVQVTVVNQQGRGGGSLKRKRPPVPKKNRRNQATPAAAVIRGRVPATNHHSPLPETPLIPTDEQDSAAVGANIAPASPLPETPLIPTDEQDSAAVGANIAPPTQPSRLRVVEPLSRIMPVHSHIPPAITQDLSNVPSEIHPESPPETLRQPLSQADAAQPQAACFPGLNGTGLKQIVQWLFQKLPDMDPQSRATLFGEDNATYLQSLMGFRHLVDEQIIQAGADTANRQEYAQILVNGFAPYTPTSTEHNRTGDAAIAMPNATDSTIQKSLRELYQKLKGRTERCTLLLLNLSNTPGRLTRHLTRCTNESRRVVELEAAALTQETLVDEDTEDIIMSQHGTTTVNTCAISRCSACQTAPIANILLPCGHGVCSSGNCRTLEHCPICRQPIDTITKLRIFD